MIQPFSDIDARSLKAMTGELVAAVGGTSTASQLLPVLNDRGQMVQLSVSRISGYCTISDMRRFMPIQCVARLEIAAGQGIVSKWMTDRLARDGTSSPGGLCYQDLRRLSREMSDLNIVVDESLADGAVTLDERGPIRAAIRDLRRELDTLEAKLDQP